MAPRAPQFLVGVPMSAHLATFLEAKQKKIEVPVEPPEAFYVLMTTTLEAFSGPEAAKKAKIVCFGPLLASLVTLGRP